MTDPVLHVLAWMVLCIDVGLLVGAVYLAYIILRYRRGIALWYVSIKELNKEK